MYTPYAKILFPFFFLPLMRVYISVNKMKRSENKKSAHGVGEGRGEEGGIFTQ